MGAFQPACRSDAMHHRFRHQAGLHIGADDAKDNVLFEDLEEIRTIGSGASSTVKLAKHKHTGASSLTQLARLRLGAPAACPARCTGVYYALKCIGLYMKDMRSMLLTELRTLFQSDCDALVSFHGATYREGQVAVVLEYLNLGGLEGIMAKAGPIPEHVLACMAYQVLWALGYLAYERRIHRDIKPANILVDTSGNVKLTDFGISREMQTAMLAKTFVGTFKYMAPERIVSAHAASGSGARSPAQPHVASHPHRAEWSTTMPAIFGLLAW